MTKDEELFKKRLLELSNIAYERNIVTFSDFLNLNELNILHTLPKNLLPTSYRCFGGYELAERQMVAFIPDALCYDYKYPIAILKIEAVNKRYAQELTHRDYLGALLNLGIDRSKVGDIAVDVDVAFIFLHENLADFVKNHFVKIRHTNIRLEQCEVEDLHYTPKVEIIKGTVASLRLDAVLSLGFSISRSKILPLIERGLVFINGKLITNSGHALKEGEIISLRKMGRIRFDQVQGGTKKGRILIQIIKYI